MHYQDNQKIIAELENIETLDQLHASDSYQKHKDYLTQLFLNPCVIPNDNAKPKDKDRIRIAHWNIEKGKYLDEIIEMVRTHPALREADLISINEADLGMARSGNRFTAKELGDALGMHMVFAPVYLEFTKGSGDDLKANGKNTIALQGNAILSKYPIHNPRIIHMPSCFDHFNFFEKRMGRRNALSAEFEINEKRLIFVSTHLEVRNSPDCRATQMKAIIKALEQNDAPPRAIIAGDFNTNATARGGLKRTLQASLRLSFADKDRLIKLFAAPQSAELLFELLHKHGFTETGFNDESTTCVVPMKGLEDKTTMPQFLVKAFENRMGRFNHELNFRLDWIVGKNVKGHNPISVQAGGKISDHDPISTDIIF